MRNKTLFVIFLLLLFFFQAAISCGIYTSYSSSASSNSLSSHWVPGWGYRDELNASDIDNQNFWTDNAGKILTYAMVSNDSLDASNVLQFLEHNGLNTGDYLPEAVVNSSFQRLNSGTTLTNRIAMLQGTNFSSGLDQLAIGNYYAGEQVLGYLGSDRILINGTIYRSSNSTILETPNGFVKRTSFVTSEGDFYVYLNSTMSSGNPYVNVTMQVLPLITSLNSSDLLYLQVFSSAGQFDNASLYDSNGNYLRHLAYDNGSPSAQNGTIIAYSKQESALTQDSIAISLGASNASSVTVNDFEHWYHDGAFDGLSWVGVAYDAPVDTAGKLSSPIYAKVYPIDHMDYRLVNDTARYIALGTKNTTVSPPVSFGFVAFGLALEASMNPGNVTLNSLARGYWNYYYSKYNGNGYSTPYARSINLLAIAGFTLYGCNSTVESFTRNFLGNTSGSAIEEYGWGVAALYKLKTCTNSQNGIALYDSFLNSFGTSKSNFVVRGGSFSSDLNPSSTFQFGEAASGLMLGGVPYNDPVVLKAMDAVYQSNIGGTLLNQPYHGDLANTETIPAILLSTYLFQNEMRKATGGYWISGIQNANVTSIDYVNGTLLISAFGNNGNIEITSPNGSNIVRAINGFGTYAIALNVVTMTMTTNPITQTTNIDLCGPTDLSGCNNGDWILLIASIVLFVAGALLVVRSNKLGQRHKVG